jgi:lipoyl(octanoyl) transferase
MDAKNRKVIFHDLGLVDYKQAWDFQEELFSKTVNLKLQNRKNELASLPQTTTENHLIFCEHPHVYTLGKSGSLDNLLLNQEQLKEHQATFYKINRGGDITYHGPGQLVAYPILDLDHFFTDIHKYLRLLEEAVIKTIAEYGIIGGRLDGYTGVWIEPENEKKARKICAMGVRCSRWVTMHGIGFNVNSDLNYFKHIIPCGIKEKDVTSIEKETGKKVDMDELKQKLKNHLQEIFEMEIVE